MNTHPSLFSHEARSVWRDHRLALAILAAAPVLGAADYLMLARSLSYDTHFGFVAILTRALPVLSMAVAYLIFKDIGGDATGSPYQVLPMPRRVVLGVRFALLGALGVLWPALIAAAVAVVTFPDTCAEQASHFAVWNALGVVFGAFLGVRVSRLAHLVAYLGLGLGGLSIATVVFGGGGKPSAFFSGPALIPPVILAVFVWRTLVSGRALATRRIWCAELVLVIAVAPLLAWSYSASIHRLIAGERPGPKEINLPEVTGVAEFGIRNEHGNGTYNDMPFAYRSAIFAGLPKVSARYVSTMGEWRVLGDDGVASPWRLFQPAGSVPDAPIVTLLLPDDGLQNAMIRGESEQIHSARVARFSAGTGGLNLQLPKNFGPKAKLPYSSLKDYQGKTLELRGKAVIQLAVYREQFRTKDFTKEFRQSEQGRSLAVKISIPPSQSKDGATSVNVISKGCVLSPWLLENPGERVGQCAGALASGKVCQNMGNSFGGHSEGLYYGFNESRALVAGPMLDPDNPTLRPDTVVLLEQSTGDTVIVPFRVTVKIPADF